MKLQSLQRRPQRGVSLLFALLALVALTVAAVGLVRTVGTGSLVVGNIGFKMEATAAASRGAEAAIAWLEPRLVGTTLDGDVLANGYHATSKQALDPTGRNSTMSPRAVVDWNNASDCSGAGISGSFTACLNASPKVMIGENTVNWIITRLCAAAGSKDAGGNSCAVSLDSGTKEDANAGGLDYAAPFGLGSTTETSVYYRIVVRTVGARNTVSYTETIVHF